MSFTVKPRGLSAPGRGDDYHALASVHVLLYSLLKRRAGDRPYLRRLAGTAGLIGRLAANNQIRPDNEFDVSLAAADVAWGRGPEAEDQGGQSAELRCPACGNEGSTAQDGKAFDSVLWPSRSAEILRCRHCGAGVWLRAGRRPRHYRRVDARTGSRHKTARARSPCCRIIVPANGPPRLTGVIKTGSSSC